MRRYNILLLAVLIILYLGTSLILDAMYGPSIGYQQGEDYWRPDGNSGWIAHGNPAAPPPDQPSVNVPLVAHYLPILIPGFFLALFLFTPLRHILDGKPAKESKESDESKPETTDDKDTSDPTGDKPLDT